MAYVPVPYPAVLYSATGVPQFVTSAVMAATLPLDYTATPTVAAPVTMAALDPLLATTTTTVEEIVARQTLALVQPLASVPLVVTATTGPIALLL